MSEERHMGRFLRDSRGMAAVEFAMILPAMMALYFGIVEVSQAMRASQKVEQIARMLADMTARKLPDAGGSPPAVITNSDLVDLFKAAEILIWPLPKDKLRLEIDELEAGDGNRNPHPPRVMWWVTNNAETREIVRGLSVTTEPIGRSCDDSGRLYSTESDGNLNEFKTIPDSLAYTQNLHGYLVSARVQYDYGEAVLPKMFGKMLKMSQWSYAVLRIMNNSSINNPLMLTATADSRNLPLMQFRVCSQN
jgi:hypothetical protein